MRWWVAVVLACSSPPSTRAPARAVEVLPDVPYELLDHDQRVRFMKEKVEPAMRPLFQQHDPQEFADFGCKTCHGAGAEQGNWHMPAPDVPELHLEDMSQHEERDVAWMRDTIQPAMARLLGEAVYSKTNPDGFGCTHCHPIAN